MKSKEEYNLPMFLISLQKQFHQKEETTDILGWTSESETCFHHLGLFPSRSSSLFSLFISIFVFIKSLNKW